jgi:ubiquitin-protein ligase
LFDPVRMKNEEINLRELAARSNGKVTFLSAQMGNEWVAKLRLNIPCPRDSSFPNNPINSVELTIRALSGHPKVKPIFSLSPVPFLCNVFSDGAVCVGRWLPSNQLSQIVERIVRMVALDPEVTGDGSGVEKPANGAAAAWFQSIKGSRQLALPTMVMSFISVSTTAGIKGFKNLR